MLDGHRTKKSVNCFDASRPSPHDAPMTNTNEIPPVESQRERERERERTRDAAIRASVERYMQAGKELRSAIRDRDQKSIDICDRVRHDIKREAFRTRTINRWEDVYGAACTAEAQRITGGS